MAESTPAGWYPAPHASNEPRYWDGAAWSDQAAPPQAAPTVQTATPPGPPSGGGRPVSQGLALSALIVGIVAFVTGLIPWFGMLVAIAAVVLAVFALRKKQRQGLWLTGLILGGIAFITGLIVTIAFTVAVSSGSSAADDETAFAPLATSTGAPAESTPSPSASEVPAPAESQAPSPTPEAAAPVAPAAPAADQGEVTNPYPQPYVAKGLLGGEKYSLTASVLDANANARVAEWNQFNSEAPAGYKYVVVQLTMTGIDTDGVEPSLAAFDLSLATAEGNRYDNEYITMGDDMASMSDGPTLYPGNSFTGFTSYIVPESAQNFLLYDNGNYIAF